MSAGVAAHCFHPPSRRSSREIVRRSRCPPVSRTRVPEIITRLQIPDEKVFFPLNVNVISGKSRILWSSPGIPEARVFFPLNVNVLSGKSRILRSSDFECPDGYLLEVSESENVDMESSTLSPFIDETMHEQQGMAEGLAKSLSLTNLLMFMLPHEALAETCDSTNSYLKMPLLFAVAMIGATVGGFIARRRRDEMKRLNDQLRQINEVLRRQAKIESYAPGLSYAPIGRIQEKDVIVDPRKQQLLTNLRTGKNFLRSQDPKKAFVEFKTAYDLAQSLGDHLEEKKAARGLGASLQRQGKYREAIRYHSKVIEISEKIRDNSGSTEAYGAIADCYAELGDLERAGKFYDKYIARLEKD